MRTWARRLGVPALIPLACLAIYFAVFFPRGLEDRGRGSLITSFDLQSYFLPRFAYGSSELLHGRLPTWNPFEYNGLPFLATAQPEVFYPPKILLYAALPLKAAYYSFLGLHYVLLAGGMLLFLRGRGFTGVAATAGVLLWTFASPVLASNYHPIRIANFLWVPIAFHLADRVGRGEPRSFAWLSLVAAFALFSGYPEFVIDFGLLVGFHGIAAWVSKEWERPPWRTVPVLGAAFVLGAAIAAIQMFPLAEAGSVAHRTRVATETVPLVVALQERPMVFSAPGLLLFALGGLGAKRGRSALLGFAACFFMSTIGWRLLRFLPGFNMVRFPWSWRFLQPFFAAWLGAVGVEAFLATAAPGDRASKLFRIVLGGGAVFFILFCAAEWFLLAHHIPQFGRWLWPSPIATAPAAALGIAGALALFVAVLRKKGREATTLVAATLLALSQAAAYPFEALPSPIAPPTPRGEVAQLLGRGKPRGRALSTNDILWGYEIHDRIPSVLGAEESFLPWRYRQVLLRLGFATILGRIDYDAVSRAHGFLSALDMQYVAIPKILTAYMAERGFRIVRAGNEMVLGENPLRMGHAWVNYAVRVVRNAQAAEDAVFDPQFDPHQVVVLEEAPVGHYPQTTDVRATRPSAERRRSPTEVEFVVELDRPGVFVVSESAYPGWEATVDDSPARWLTADYVLKAVELGPGIHRVRFDYRPASVKWGAIVSGLALIVLGIAFWKPRRGVSSKVSVGNAVKGADPLSTASKE